MSQPISGPIAWPGYSNSPQPSPYASIPSFIPNIDFPKPYWLNKLKDLAIIGCLNPDLAYAELAVAAAGKMAWSVATPSTKQLIEQATGHSWLCGSKQVLSDVQYGEQIANSGTGRFLYGMLAGLDIAAYHAFFLSTGAVGVIDFASYAKRFQRVCNGDQSPYHGIAATGGWPAPSDDWGPGPTYLNSAGQAVSTDIVIAPGQVGVCICWTSYSGLFGTGGVITSQAIFDQDTGEMYDQCIVNNLFQTDSMAITKFYTVGGRVGRTIRLNNKVKFLQSVDNRVVAVKGGCYARAWFPHETTAPPYWFMTQNAGNP